MSLLATLQEAASLVSGDGRLAQLVRLALKEAAGPLGNAEGPWRMEPDGERGWWKVIGADGRHLAYALSFDDAAAMVGGKKWADEYGKLEAELEAAK